MKMYWNISSGINGKYIYIAEPVHFVSRKKSQNLKKIMIVQLLLGVPYYSKCNSVTLVGKPTTSDRGQRATFSPW